jgi:hypothetical protein
MDRIDSSGEEIVSTHLDGRFQDRIKKLNDESSFNKIIGTAVGLRVIIKKMEALEANLSMQTKVNIELQEKNDNFEARIKDFEEKLEQVLDVIEKQNQLIKQLGEYVIVEDGV